MSFFYNYLNYYYTEKFTLDMFLMDAKFFDIQTVPFNVNSMHFLLFKPELFLCMSLLFLAMTSVFLRSFYRLEDITLYSYFLTIYILIITQLLILDNLLYTKSFFIFNFSLVIDFYSTSVKLIIVFLSIISLIISYKKIRTSFIDLIEFPWFIGLSVFFLMVLVSSYSMITLYLSIEGLSLTLYILTSYPFTKNSMEAASKYYIFGAWSSGILLLGILAHYGLYGTFDFLTLTTALKSTFIPFSDIAAFLIIFSFLFKLGMYPFHMWAFDVYEGTWFPVTIYFMIVVKIGIFCLFIRILFYLYYSLWALKYLLIFSGMGSLIVGCLGSLTQNKLKKLFIYSSISQMGFCFFGLFIGTPEAIQKTFLFFIFYIITSLGLLIIILNTESFIQGIGLKYVTDLTNFGEHNKLEAIALSFMLLSLAGIPPLAGFWSKLFIFKLLIEYSLFSLVIFSIIISALNSFIYIKLIKCMLFDKFLSKKSEYTDFFFFDIYYTRFKWNILFLKSIIFAIAIFVCLIPLFLNEFLLSINFISAASSTIVFKT